MLCSKCGALIGDDSVFCSKCGAAVKESKDTAIEPVLENAVQVTVEPPAPVVVTPAAAPDPVVQYSQTQGESGQIPPVYTQKSTYLTQNILLTVFSVVCCMFYALPTAVTGLVFSAIAQGALKQNDMEKAQQYIKLARIFMWISFGIEIAVAAIYIISIAAGLSAGWNIFRNGLNGFDFDFDFDQFREFSDGIWR